MTNVTSQSETHLMVDRGPSIQWQAQTNILNLAASILASATIQSSVILTNGYRQLAFGITSSQAGTVTIQRYLDTAGTIPQGAAITGTLVAATALTVNSTDNNPFQSLQISVSNASGSTTANLTNVMLLLQGG